jgi:hypothetical protein
MRLWFFAALLCLAPLVANAGEPAFYMGTVVMEFDGHSTDNVLGYCLSMEGKTYDLVVSRPEDTAWLKFHIGLYVKVRGNRGTRGDRAYLFVQDLECRPSIQENK